MNCWIWSVLEPSLAVLVACGPTLGPFVAAILGRVRTKSNPSSYPSYPERRQQFSNVSDSEYPLQPMYGNYSVADSRKGAFPTANRGSSPVEDVYQGDRNVRSPHIKVQRDYTVRRSPSE